MKNRQSVTTPSKIVGLDADPSVPLGWSRWSVEDHRENGARIFDPANMGLYLSEGQEGDKRIEGNQLLEKLKAQPVYGANVLDWLLRKEDQHRIPKQWRDSDKAVYFWGTIYRDRGDGSRHVRFLFWDGSGWNWGHCARRALFKSQP